jgi:hypothetical protein
MLSWAAKRKLLYGGVVIALFGTALVLFAAAFFYPKPANPVCDGPCPTAGALSPIVHWTRVFRVREGVYSAVAYVENPNINIVAHNVKYTFKLYDTDNVLVYEIHGQTYIPARKAFGIFEGAIPVGSRLPTRAVFRFDEQPVWQPVVAISPELNINNQSLSDEQSAPKLQADIVNPSVADVNMTIEVIAILYDASGDAIASSKTIVDRLSSNQPNRLTFTWPEPFRSKVERIEILYKTPLI